MTLFVHEIKRNKLSLIIWSSALALLLGVTVLLYPEMSKQMGELGDMFESMGSLSDALGMDQMYFGEFMNYFSVEVGESLGLGASFFAAIIGVAALCKEEKDKTAEFLLTHPISRAKIITEKLLSVLFQLLVLNASVIAVTSVAALAIDAEIKWGKFILLFLANLIMQIEIASICFCISAFLRGNGIGIALGVSALFYFLNIISNITDKADFLKYITPYGYTNGSFIVSNGKLEIKYLVVGLLITAISIILAYLKYTKKDIS